jgi:hypothetical protein
MVMTRHSHNDAGKPMTLFIVLSLSLWVIANTEAQEKTIRPDNMACPVTANLFPEQVRRTDFIRFIFPAGAIPRRISIALTHPDKKDLSIEYRWVGNGNWGAQTGVFVANGEGKTDCFFLGYHARIPENVPCNEFVLLFRRSLASRRSLFPTCRQRSPSCSVQCLNWSRKSMRLMWPAE